jgi:hypothetical protein
MSGPYFQKQSWPAFTYQGQTYDFTHLDEHEVEVNDSDGTARRIAVSFSDHCFTREPETGDDPGLRYPDSTRATGHFCLERYQLSLGLSQHIAHAMQGNVWIVRDAAFAAVPTVNSTAAEVREGVAASPLKQGGDFRAGAGSSPWSPEVRDASRCLQGTWASEK